MNRKRGNTNCRDCIFSHDRPFLKSNEFISEPRHCALHYCTVDADDSCRDGVKRKTVNMYDIKAD